MNSNKHNFWPTVPAGELVKLIYGKTLTASDRVIGTIPVYGVNGITGWHNEALGTGPTVILGRVGMGNLGIEKCDGPFWVTENAYYTEIDQSRLDVHYFYYAIKMIGLNHLKDGSSKPILTRSRFSIVPLTLPPLSEQRAIAEILGSLDDKIEANRRMNETLEATARAIFKSWFVDFDPVHVKARGETPSGMDAETAVLFPDSFEDSELGPIPSGWRVGILDEVMEIISGKRPLERYDERSEHATIPLYGGGGVMAYVDEPLFMEPILITGRVGTLGKVFRVVEPSWPSDNTIVLRPIESNVFEFIYFLISDFDFVGLNRGSTQPLIAQKDVRAIKVVYPPFSLLRTYSELVHPFFQATDITIKQTQTLSETRDALLPKLVSGEVRVPLLESS